MFKKSVNTIVIFFLLTAAIFSQQYPEGFSANEYSEQILSFRFEPEVKVMINAPAAEEFKNDRPSAIVLYALPNGNSTEWTVGKIVEPGDDWHFGIQNIGAQTRFIRKNIQEYNLITVYLETDQKSWPAWKAAHADYAGLVQKLIDTVCSFFRKYETFVVLSGHSGGGRFIFSFIDANEKIPSYVKRICFLDSNYGYDSSYTPKFSEWLRSSEENFLCVMAYNDSSVVLNGKKIVSPTGGTWYRSRKFKEDLSREFAFNTMEDDSLIHHTALDGRIKIILRKNPDNEIFHTVQVEKNGFIHSLLTGTKYENAGYKYFGERVY